MSQEEGGGEEGGGNEVHLGLPCGRQKDTKVALVAPIPDLLVDIVDVCFLDSH